MAQSNAQRQAAYRARKRQARLAAVPDDGPDGESVPDGLAEAGRKLWSAVVEHLELTAPEREILLAACRTADRLTQIAAELEGQPLLTSNKFGPIVNPLATEQRQQGLAMARLLASLKLPDELGLGAPGQNSAERRPRRGAVRGFYGPRSG